MNKLNVYWTIKDEEGNLRPKASLWPVYDHGSIKAEYYQEEIDKYMKKAKNENLKLVKVEIIEI